MLDRSTAKVFPIDSDEEMNHLIAAWGLASRRLWSGRKLVTTAYIYNISMLAITPFAVMKFGLAGFLPETVAGLAFAILVVVTKMRRRLLIKRLANYHDARLVPLMLAAISDRSRHIQKVAMFWLDSLDNVVLLEGLSGLRVEPSLSLDRSLHSRNELVRLAARSLLSKVPALVTINQART